MPADPDDPREGHLAVPRTARYYTLGGEGTAADGRVDEVWFVLHGYGQLARHFVRPFRAFATARRLFVAPEALSRFYLALDAPERRVGAAWMTSEDRLREIDDYLVYLDALAAHVLVRHPGPPAVHVLGFSQGAATAARWALHGRQRVQRLVLWGGGLPDDVEDDLLRDHPLTLVAGDGDEYATPERVAALRARLDGAGLAYEAHAFEGGHRLDAETLERVLAG